MEFLGKIFDGLLSILAPIIVDLVYIVGFLSVLALVLAILILPPAFILRLPQWISSHGDSRIKIKYSTFVSMYNIKPCAWELEDDTVFYKAKINNHGWNHEVATHFCFGSYIDYCRYRCFLRKARKEENLKELKFMEKQNCEELEKVLSRWQNDIEEYKKNSNAEIKKKLSELGVLGDNTYGNKSV